MGVTFSELSGLERKMHCHHRTAHQKAMGRLGLRYGQPLMLMIIYDHQPLYQKDLAAHMNVTPASVTVSIKRMEKSGWISKVSDSDDLRCTAIRLTERGEALARRCKEEMERIDREKFVGFTQEEMAQLADFYRRMNGNLQELEQKGE